ncbi:MAG: hypothetical protein JKX70_05190 [Phycisphaerales bacterium]|nr:hypothetical protein [Phycisphaerales bacterium]
MPESMRMDVHANSNTVFLNDVANPINTQWIEPSPNKNAVNVRWRLARQIVHEHPSCLNDRHYPFLVVLTVTRHKRPTAFCDV